MAYLYRHIRLDKNEPFYIGIGKDDGSYKRAKRKSQRNLMWKRIVNKTDYAIEIVMDGLTWDEACEKEREFIALYGRRHDGGVLANMTLGGEGIRGMTGLLCPSFGRVVSEDTKHKIRKGFQKTMETHDKAYYKKVVKNPKVYSYTKRFTTTHLKNLRQSHVKRFKSVLAFDVHGRFWMEFKSLSEASAEIGINKGNISNACKKRSGRRMTYKGFIWEYKSAFPDEKAIYVFVIRLFKADTLCPTYASCW